MKPIRTPDCYWSSAVLFIFSGLCSMRFSATKLLIKNEHWFVSVNKSRFEPVKRPKINESPVTVVYLNCVIKVQSQFDLCWGERRNLLNLLVLTVCWSSFCASSHPALYLFITQGVVRSGTTGPQVQIFFLPLPGWRVLWGSSYSPLPACTFQNWVRSLLLGTSVSPSDWLRASPAWAASRLDAADRDGG